MRACIGLTPWVNEVRRASRTAAQGARALHLADAFGRLARVRDLDDGRSVERDQQDRAVRAGRRRGRRPG